MASKVRSIAGIAAVAIIIPIAVICWVHYYRQEQEEKSQRPYVVNGHVVLPTQMAGQASDTAPPKPPRVVRPHGPTTQQLVDAHAIDDSQQAELASLLDRKEPMTQLPAWIKKVGILSGGRTIFYSSTSNKLGGADAMKDSVQRFADGTSSIIHGGRLLLADSHGRFWVAADNEGPLYCLSGGEWSQPSMAVDAPVDPAHPKRPANNHFGGQTNIVAAKEFSDGSCRFLIRTPRQAYRVLTATPDGQTTCQSVGDADDMDLNTYAGGAKFVEQDHGIITIVPSAVPIPKVFQYDGKAWQTITLPKMPGRVQVYDVTGVQDGSLLVMGSDCRMSTFWSPAAQAGEQSKIDGYIADLDDRAYPKRRDAYVALTLCGEMARKQLAAAQANGPSPEMQASIQRLLGELDHQQAPEPENAEQFLYAGRYWFGQARVASADWKGRPLLDLTEFVDTMKDPSGVADRGHPQTSSDEALAVLQPNGDLNVIRILTKDDLDKAGYAESPSRFFTDREWQLWGTAGKVFNADLSLAPRVQGFFINLFDGEDASGRMIGHVESKFYVMRPGVAPAAAELEEQQFTVNWVQITPENNAAIGCSFQVVGEPSSPAKVIYKLDQTKTDWLTVPLDQAAMTVVQPFKAGKVFAFFNSPATSSMYAAGYYDGTDWHFDVNPTTLVTKIPKLIADGAPPVLDNHNHFAGDGQGHFWAYLNASEPQPDAQKYGVQAYPCERLLYFDGKKTHDVWADWNRLDGKPVSKPESDPLHSAPGEGYPANRTPARSILNGKALLVQNKEKLTWQIHYDDDKLVVDPIAIDGEVLTPEIGPVHPGDRHVSALSGLGVFKSAETSDGTLWFQLDSPAKLARLKEKKITVFGPISTIFMADSRDRVWVREQDGKTETLMVYQADARVQANLAGVPDLESMVEGPDGRLWLGDATGLSELRVTGDGPAMQISQLHHWAWPMMRQSFSPAFADSSGYLWCHSGQAGITRVKLPPAMNPTSQP